MKSKKIITRNNLAKINDKIMTGVFYCVGGFFLALLFVLAGYIIIKGLLDFYPDLLRFDRKGIGNQFFNTIYLVFLSLVISVPLGIAAGIYMAEYARQGKITSIIRICIEALSSLPSIVIGLFGYFVFILMTGASWNLMAGGLSVFILSISLITTKAEDGISSLLPDFKQRSIGLG